MRRRHLFLETNNYKMIANSSGLKRPSQIGLSSLIHHFQSHQWKCEVNPWKVPRWESGNSSKRDFIITSAKISDALRTIQQMQPLSGMLTQQHNGSSHDRHPHCAKGRMCCVIDINYWNFWRCYGQINHQQKLNVVARMQKNWVLCFVCLLSREVKWGDQQGVCQVTSHKSPLLIPAVENIEVGNWKWPIYLKHLASVFASCCMWTKYRCVGAKRKIFLMCNYSGHDY
jgi:hypothetical protein